MVLLEAEVHSQLRSFLRQNSQPPWNHYLTMARLVSRALRVNRSALIQTGSTLSRYGFSYLIPALLSDRPVLLVAPAQVQQRLLEVELPQIQEWLQVDRSIALDCPNFTLEDGHGLIITSPQTWLSDRLEGKNRFPQDIPVLIDHAQDLEEWTRDYFTVTLNPPDWDRLLQCFPDQVDALREIRVRLTKALFSHPKNPYECYLLDADELDLLHQLFDLLDGHLIPPFARFHLELQTDNSLLWAAITRETGQLSLKIHPVDIANLLTPIWQDITVVLMGGFLDANKTALTYRTTVGLEEEILCLTFSPNRQTESIQLYAPDRLPLPNTPEFQGVLLEQIRILISLSRQAMKPVVILLEDIPLKNQFGAILASEWGSKVQVEKAVIAKDGILICGWDFWHTYQETFPTPQLLIIATLPIPSLENPLVAGRVAYYKRQRQDWFRLYLLPTALKAIQQAVMPLRESQGIVALLDNRVNSRSYGTQILTALEPYAKINYIDITWFNEE